MGDRMILNEKELKTCLEYALIPLLNKYNVQIKESHLFIQESIQLQAVIIYQDHTFDMNISFMIGYKNQKFYFYNIDGKVEYLFLQLSVMNILKQILNDENITIQNNQCTYVCDLPIEKILIQENSIQVLLK